MALPTIKNTNTKSFTDLQISRQTNSSGILSDQNLSGGASGNRLQNQTENHYEVIDDIIRRNVIHQDDSSDSGTYLSFTEEVRLRNGYPKLISHPYTLISHVYDLIEWFNYPNFRMVRGFSKARNFTTIEFKITISGRYHDRCDQQ